MGVNQVYYGEDALVDLTHDTVTPEKLLRGTTAHNAAGNLIVGTMDEGGYVMPVGTVMTFAAAKTGEVSGKTTPTGEFPADSGFLVCDGAYVFTDDYQDLADYFTTYYGSADYFTPAGQTVTGKFKLPNWSKSFPVNGVICIKA